MDSEKKKKEIRKVFESYVGDLSGEIEGSKKEAVEKLFFLTETQFSEICEDLVEEIERRKEGREEMLSPSQKYPHKRNVIREQLSFLENEEMCGLVGDTLLVLRHKNPMFPEDRVECLDRLVRDLQEIVASNTPVESPAASLKALEADRRKVYSAKGFPGKLSAFFIYARRVMKDSDLEMLEHMEQELAKEKCVLAEAAEELAMRECKEKESAFFQVDLIEDPFERKAKIAVECAKMLRETKPSALDKAVSAVASSFEEIELCIEEERQVDSFQKACSSLYSGARGLLRCMKDRPHRSLRELESLKAPSIKSECEAMAFAAEANSAIEKAFAK
jgi:hypothetical protein